MRQGLLAIVLVFLWIPIQAEAWKLTADFNVSLTQSAYSDNWNGTELGNIAWAAKLNTTAQKQLTEMLHNRNTLKLAFGQTHQQVRNDAGKKYWARPETSTDVVDLESILRFTLHGWVDPFVSGRLETRFLDERFEDDTRMFNPMTFTEAAGVARNFIDQDDYQISLRLGAAFRQHIDRDVPDGMGGEETLSTQDGGLELVGEYMRSLNETLKVESRLEVFQALYNSEEDDLPNDDWQSPDVTWLTTLNAKIYGALSCNLEMEWRYDKEQDTAGQFRQTLSLGLAWSLL